MSPADAPSAERLLGEAEQRDLDAQLDAKASAVATSAVDPEGREGLPAFAARRSPRFRD
jgi:2-(1,2-epoxy-1,2-dihydrophenyl)acetyl-CoA isomerase